MNGFRKITEIAEYLCSANITVFDAITRMNSTKYLFQIILDENQKVLGTLTDGDVRRFLLNGGDLNCSILECMNSNPLLFDANTLKNQAETIDKNLVFYPLVERNLQFVSAYTFEKNTSVTSAFIFAGGLGKRLGELTKNTPKPLLKVKGRPIIDMLIAKIESMGIDQVTISANYKSEQIDEFIKSRKNSANIVVIKEPEFMGTAGSLSLIENINITSTLVLNGDIVTDASLHAICDFFDNSKSDIVIGAVPYEVKLQFGVINCDNFGNFVSLAEKPCKQYFIAGGIYVLSKEVIRLAKDKKKIDMPELINMAADKQFQCNVFPIYEKWLDVGTPKDFQRANND